MIYDKLFDYQKEIVDKNRGKGSYGLFLDCGLGKTPLALAFAEVNNCSKVLIITINSKSLENENISGSWLEWGSKSDIGYRLYNKKSKTLEFKGKPSLFIINYEGLFNRSNNKKSKVELKSTILDFLEASKGENLAIIIDESHKMKNLQSLQTTAIFKIQSLAKLNCKNVYTYLLTGTPFTTGFIDLYTQLKCLGCNINKGQFEEAFCIRGNLPGLLGWQQPIIGYKNIDKLYELVHQYAITIKSKEVVKLPEQVFINHIIPQTKEFNLLTKEKINSKPNLYYRNLDYPNSDYLAETSGSLWMRTRQISIGFQGNAEKSTWYNKDRLKELEKLLSENEDNYVLFYNYTPELLEIYDLCIKLGYNTDVYCGEIKNLTFYDKYSKMNESEQLTTKKNIILANFASGSTGMNWQLYNKCIIFSLPLYKDWEQGLKRVHRVGQKETVIYHIFYQDNWLDKAMKKSLEECTQYTEDMFRDGLKNINND